MKYANSRNVHVGIAALAGALASPALAWSPPPPVVSQAAHADAVPAPTAATAPPLSELAPAIQPFDAAPTSLSASLLLGPPLPPSTGAAEPGPDCVADALGRLQRRLQPDRPAWAPEFSKALLAAVFNAAGRHDLPPALLLGVMINESDLDETAARLSRSGNRIAKDSGLMGIRCILDRRGVCTNGLVRGMPWRQVMDPFTNVELGARYLAHYRDGAGRRRVERLVAGPDGVAHPIARMVRCRHRDHAYWAHYNHGTRYLSQGPARHYPHHVAVLAYAAASSLGLDASALLSSRLTVRDPRGPARTADRPVEERYVKLCRIIRETAPRCPAPPLLVRAPVAPLPGWI